MLVIGGRQIGCQNLNAFCLRKIFQNNTVVVGCVLIFLLKEALVKTRQNLCPIGQQTDLLSRLVTETDPVDGDKLTIEQVSFKNCNTIITRRIYTTSAIYNPYNIHAHRTSKLYTTDIKKD